MRRRAVEASDFTWTVRPRALEANDCVLMRLGASWKHCGGILGTPWWRVSGASWGVLGRAPQNCPSPRYHQTSQSTARHPKTSPDFTRHSTTQTSPDSPRHPKTSEDLTRHPKTSTDIPAGILSYPKTSPSIERRLKTSQDIQRHPKTSPDIPRSLFLVVVFGFCLFLLSLSFVVVFCLCLCLCL